MDNLICLGSEHGTRYRCTLGGFYFAPACALALPLSDKGKWISPAHQSDRRAWYDPGASGKAYDESGARFY